jgi:N-acetylmuramoyl-L-alanine amidase
MRSSGRRRAALVAIMLACVAPVASGATPKASYTEALAREAMLRRDLDAAPAKNLESPLLTRIRGLVSEYERLAKRHPRSGYSDNALYQAGTLSADAFWYFGEDPDRKAALRLFAALRAQFPSSSLNRQVTSLAKRLSAARPPQANSGSSAITSSGPKPDDRPMLKAIRREVLADALRITLELEREAAFREERLEGPPRVFVDLQNTRAMDELRDRTLGFADDVVRQIRVGRHVGATRVVLDLQDSARHSVYALYNPYRVVIDFERSGAATKTGSHEAPKTAKPTAPEDTKVAKGPGQLEVNGATGESGAVGSPANDARAAEDARSRASLDSRTDPGATWTAEPPAAPDANRTGGFSIARQLGLGISRVVIDAGHGGHDPGAKVKGLNEADLTLDVAQRLEKLLLKVPGVEVVMTRRANVYIPLEERTAIANRAGADLFLSIHVNASRNAKARGIETYFLNFAPNPEAEAIAARENAGSSKTMHHLPDIVKAIALNNKLDESRDFASLIQTSMIERLKKANRDARSLGVKQAPFMVLIGATMPSVLAEISFLTNRQEGALLRTPAYRQAIAEALFSGIAKYQKSLKSSQTAAIQ